MNHHAWQSMRHRVPPHGHHENRLSHEVYLLEIRSCCVSAQGNRTLSLHLGIVNRSLAPTGGIAGSSFSVGDYVDDRVFHSRREVLQ